MFTPSRAMSYTTPLISSTLSFGTCTPSFPTTRSTSTSSNFFSGEIEPCADPRRVSIGYLAEPTTFTGCEPKHFTENKDLAEHQDLRVKPLFFHRPSIASTYQSAVLNRTWTKSKFVLCWLHHCTCRSEKQMRTDCKFITL